MLGTQRDVTADKTSFDNNGLPVLVYNRMKTKSKDQVSPKNTKGTTPLRAWGKIQSDKWRFSTKKRPPVEVSPKSFLFRGRRRLQDVQFDPFRSVSVHFGRFLASLGVLGGVGEMGSGRWVVRERTLNSGRKMQRIGSTNPSSHYY